MTTPNGANPPDEEQTAEILEHKKWLVNRFEVQMENMIREIMTVRETFNSYATKTETEFKELRSISLAALALAAALILGISYDKIGITYSNIITAIIVVVSIGIVSFIVLTSIKKKAYSTVMEVDLAFLSALDKLNFLLGHYIEVSVDIKEIDIDRLRFFINYGWFAGIISRLEQNDAYDKVYKSLLFRRLRPQIEEPVKLGKAQMDFGVKFYKTFEQQFHRYKEDFLELGFVHNTFLSRYKIVFPNPEIEVSSS